MLFFKREKVQQCPEIFAHHVEGTLGQVVVLASKDFLDKIIIATISWIDYNSQFIPFINLIYLFHFPTWNPEMVSAMGTSLPGLLVKTSAT